MIKLLTALKVVILILLISLMFLLTACSNAPVKINLVAASQLNLDTQNHALPVLVRLYELSAAEPFNSATFRQLWRHDSHLLGATLLHRQEIIINPGQTLAVNLPANNNASYVGALAIFRRPGLSEWRTLIAMPTAFDRYFSQLQIALHGNRIFIVDN